MEFFSSSVQNNKYTYTQFSPIAAFQHCSRHIFIFVFVYLSKMCLSASLYVMKFSSDAYQHCSCHIFVFVFVYLCKIYLSASILVYYEVQFRWSLTLQSLPDVAAAPNCISYFSKYISYINHIFPNIYHIKIIFVQIYIIYKSYLS